MIKILLAFFGLRTTRSYASIGAYLVSWPHDIIRLENSHTYLRKLWLLVSSYGSTIAAMFTNLDTG